MPISRRRFVLGTAVVALAGGAGVASEFLRHPHPRRDASPGPRAPTTPPAPPRAPALENALARERALLTRLARAATAAPALAASIAILRADHHAHVEALTDLIVAAGVTPSLAAAAEPTTSPTTPLRRPTVADLVRWETVAAVSFRADFDSATGSAATVLASIYACEQTHAAWLA